MAEGCTVCQRPDRAAINAALGANEGVNRTASKFGVSRTTMKRHAKHAQGPASAPPPPPEPEAGDHRRGRKCAVCSSPKREAIDELLCAGVQPHVIQLRVAPGPGDDSISYHRDTCIPALIAGHRSEAAGKLIERTEARVEEIAGEARALLARAHKLVEDAEGAGPVCVGCAERLKAATPRERAATITAATRPLAELRQCLELIAKMRGELRPEIDLNVILASPHMWAVMEAHRRALRAYPEARAAVRVELERLEAEQAPRLTGAAARL